MSDLVDTGVRNFVITLSEDWVMFFSKLFLRCIFCLPDDVILNGGWDLKITDINHAAHTIVSWSNPKQRQISHISALVMIMIWIFTHGTKLFGQTTQHNGGVICQQADTTLVTECILFAHHKLSRKSDNQNQGLSGQILSSWVYMTSKLPRRTNTKHMTIMRKLVTSEYWYDNKMK